VTKKLTELTIEPFKTKNTAIKPTSVLPMAVYRVRVEKGVTIAHPGNKSRALRSTTHVRTSSFKKRLYNEFWLRATKSLQRQASRENFNCRQLLNVLKRNEELRNIDVNF